MQADRPKDGDGKGSAPALRLEGLSKVYRDFWGRRKTWALRDVSLDVGAGEIFGLLGPNGSGKTTALKVIVGLLRATSGKASALGRKPGDPRALARIGYLPEEPAHYGFLTALESLEFYGRLFGLDRRERRARAAEMLRAVGLEGEGARPVKELSRGMARRLGIAQALINRPDLLILDEPTSGLDPVAHRWITDLFVRLGEGGTTILISSHLLSEVERICSRIGILAEGRLLLEGRVSGLLSEADSIEIRTRGIDEEALRRAARKAGGEVTWSHAARRSLEEVFLRALEKEGEG